MASSGKTVANADDEARAGGTGDAGGAGGVQLILRQTEQ